LESLNSVFKASEIETGLKIYDINSSFTKLQNLFNDYKQELNRKFDYEND